MKLALGTVQLGLPYGVNNQTGVPDEDEIKSIFSVAKAAGITIVDTAIAYGDAEEKIGSLSAGNFSVVSKLPAFTAGNYSEKWLMDTVEGSLQRLQSESLFGLLLHRPAQLLEAGGKSLFKGLQRLKSEGKVHNIGISIYEPAELEKIIGEFDIDIVQTPISILDRRIISSGWLSRLGDAGIQVHARSIFLQGLLLTEPEKRLSKFSPWSEILAKYDSWLSESGYTALQACIGFVSALSEIHCIITGIDNSQHLRQIIEASKAELISIPDEIVSNDIRLINPLSWLDF